MLDFTESKANVMKLLLEGYLWIKQIWSGMTAVPIENNSETTQALIKRYLSKKSTLDSLSFQWVERPISYKIKDLLIIMMSSVIFGWLCFGAPFFLAFVACLMAFSMHITLVLHVKNRQEAALSFVRELTGLNEILSHNENQFNQKMDELKEVIQCINDQSKKRKEQTFLLETAIEKLEKENLLLIDEVDKIKKESELFARQSELAHKSVQLMTQQMGACAEGLAANTQAVDTIGQSAAAFSKNVEAFDKERSHFAELVNRFSLFVIDNTKKTKEICSKETKVFIEEQKKLNDEYDAMIGQFGVRVV